MTRDDILALYREIAEESGLPVKGKKTAYTATGGNMWSFLDADGVLCLRLSDAGRTEWAQDFPDDPVLQYGSVMRGYVAVPPEMLADRELLAAWFARAAAHGASLKPKTTKKTQG